MKPYDTASRADPFVASENVFGALVAELEDERAAALTHARLEELIETRPSAPTSTTPTRWPIATGIVEGACRHLIADRLNITGARWGLDGAEAVLNLRTVISNGGFERYWTFHLQQEHQRVHQARYQYGHQLAA